MSPHLQDRGAPPLIPHQESWQPFYRRIVRQGNLAALAATTAEICMNWSDPANYVCALSNLVSYVTLKTLEMPPKSRLRRGVEYALSFLPHGHAQRHAPHGDEISRKSFAFWGAGLSHGLNVVYAALIYGSSPIGFCMLAYSLLHTAQLVAVIRYNNLSEAEKNNHARHRIKRAVSNLSGTIGMALEPLPFAQYAVSTVGAALSGNYAMAAAESVYGLQSANNMRAHFVQHHELDEDEKHLDRWYRDLPGLAQTLIRVHALKPRNLRRVISSSRRSSPGLK